VLTIGLYVLLATGGLAAVLAWRAGGRFAGPGLLAGAGLMPLYVGYLNRGGPGMVCTATTSGVSCVQQMSPWPWVAVGVCLIGGGIGLGVRTRRSRRADR
jgi:hypothetical protein